MTDDEIVIISDSLEQCSDLLGDIVPHVYRRFFKLDPTAAALMEYSDEHMRGRMFASVLELFVSNDPFESDGFLAWELENHVNAYAVTPAMYGSLFNAFIGVVREALQDDWSTEVERAWMNRVQRVMTEVSRRG